MKMRHNSRIRHWRYILICILIALCQQISAQVYRGGTIYQIQGSGLYWAAVKTDYFREFVAQQRQDNWCWAACAQMVLNYQGVDVTQEDVVRRVFGAEYNRPGTADDIAKGTNGWHFKNHRIKSYTEQVNYSTATSLIIDLRDKYPLVVGLRMPGQDIGHAYVLTGISFYIKNNRYYPQEVILRDPWPENPSRLKLEWDDFYNRVHTIVHIHPY